MSALANLSRAERRHAERYMQRENAKWPNELKEWPRSEWPVEHPEILRLWRSRGFLVQEHAASLPAIVRLSILRTALESGGGWQQDITWEELQRIKREAGYGGQEGVEVFPPDCDVVNVANIRHIWILPAGHLPFAWRKS